jgi:hypothetical protein
MKRWASHECARLALAEESRQLRNPGRWVFAWGGSVLNKVLLEPAQGGFAAAVISPTPNSADMLSSCAPPVWVGGARYQWGLCVGNRQEERGCSAMARCKRACADATHAEHVAFCAALSARCSFHQCHRATGPPPTPHCASIAELSLLQLYSHGVLDGSSPTRVHAKRFAHNTTDEL